MKVPSPRATLGENLMTAVNGIDEELSFLHEPVSLIVSCDSLAERHDG